MNITCDYLATAAAIALVIICHMMSNVANTLFDFKTGATSSPQFRAPHHLARPPAAANHAAGFDTVEHADDRLIVSRAPQPHLVPHS
jgi:hypothetical protein